MTQKQAIQLFEERKVRTVWDDEAGKWYVSIVDVIAVLTESKDAAAYWRKLKQRLKAEGNGNRDKLSRFENDRSGWQDAPNRCG